MTSKRDIICRDLHTLEPATLHDERQADVQAFLDTLSIVERHVIKNIVNLAFRRGADTVTLGMLVALRDEYRENRYRSAQPDER